ncbi:MAG TPA: trypsin-like peptidase domain-containing protein [Gaiellales bacterium]|nr:trypsin-like peptidase domain-containing protein [Gaiellales bacterium]
MARNDEGEAVELEDAQRLPGAVPPRRVHSRLIVAVLLAVALAAVAAGLALARTRPASIGTGVVVIDTDLGYQDGRAAGTGMVLTSSGLVLTNNHVIRDATAIRVVLPSSGRSYRARVVGYDVTDDVAVLQASGASNLKTISVGDSATVSTGESVKALGNAGGTGSLTSASGSVTGVNRAITVSDDQGGSEHLTGLIQTSAAVRPGDSGGPLLNAAGQVVGMDTAASMGDGTASQGFAIPINRAVPIANQIVRGEASATVHVGDTAFLGVEVSGDTVYGSGAVVTAVVPGSPADAAGLSAGDLITSVGGRAISSPSGLTAFVMTQTPGAPLSTTFIDQAGTTRTTNLRLASGPPR